MHGGTPGGPALAPALPLRDGEGHALQPLLVGLRGADLGHDGAQQFVHQLQHLVRILSVVRVQEGSARSREGKTKPPNTRGEFLG